MLCLFLLQKFTIKIYDVLTSEFVASCRGEKILESRAYLTCKLNPTVHLGNFLEKKKKRSTYQFLILYSNEKNCLTSADTVCLYYLSKESPQTLPDKCAEKQCQRDRTCNRADNFFCLEYNDELLHEAFGVQNKHK